MIEKTDFLIFAYDIISNEVNKDCQASDPILQRSIEELYNKIPVTDNTYKALLTATFKTMEEVAPLLSEMDMQSTMTAGEVKSIDTVWENHLAKEGFPEEKAEVIVEKYSYDFIQVLQKEDDE